MAPSEIYVCDADCLINLYRHFKRKALNALRRAIKNDEVKLPEGVVRELGRQTDKLKKFMQAQRAHLEITASTFPALHSEVPRLERLCGDKIRLGLREYDGFWPSQAGRRSADAQVVAVAKILKGGAVSDDQAVKLVCALEGMPCVGWLESHAVPVGK